MVSARDTPTSTTTTSSFLSCSALPFTHRSPRFDYFDMVHFSDHSGLSCRRLMFFRLKRWAQTVLDPADPVIGLTYQ
jgi:hypothetical protein